VGVSVLPSDADVTLVRCGNPECRRVLNESPRLTPSERAPCPACGSRSRLFEKTLTARGRATASLAWTKTHEEIERHWGWLLVSLALTIAASLVGVVLAGVPGLIVGLVLGLLSFPVGLLAVTRIREIEHGGDR
jgi:hypothetical protein